MLNLRGVSKNPRHHMHDAPGNPLTHGPHIEKLAENSLLQSLAANKKNGTFVSKYIHVHIHKDK